MRIYSKSEHTIQPRIKLFFLFPLWLLFFSCSVKKPPQGAPFVFQNNIEVNGMSGVDRALLVEKLYTYLDDSLKVPTRSLLGFTQRTKPPVFDSANISRSLTFMNGYLNSLGYYGASFDTFIVRKDTVIRRDKFAGPSRQQIRTYINFEITLGKNLRVDTVVYQFDSPMLQHLADSTMKDAVLKKNSSYSKEMIGQELERLAILFRNRGFLRVSRSSLLAEGDTTDPSLISFDVDPIEQLLAAQRRRQDPRIKLLVMQRPGVDSAIFQQYYIDSVFIYPQTKITEEPSVLLTDTAFNYVYTRSGRPVIIKQREDFFSKRMIRRNNFLSPGQLYDEAAYFRTINGYWRMGPWQQVDVKTDMFIDTVPKVNFHLFLYPAKKQNFQLDLEGSQNNNISLSNTLAGRFLALSLNATHRNRNLWGTGTQAATSARFGFELNNSRTAGSQFFQTLIASANQTFSIPRLLEPLSLLVKKRQDAVRTQISFGASYTDRFKFYKQTAFNAALQFEWRKGANSFSLALPNFESVSITTTDSLLNEIRNNPSLNFAFTPGNIISIKGGWEHTFRNVNPRKAGYFRLAGELSPINFKIFNKESFQFVKFEGQLVQSLRLHSASSVNFRFYGGVGWDISGKKSATMPYFRQYVAGGSNSMRAWQLRTLGIGNSIVSDTTRGFDDRFGDMQLEANIEYRFKLFRLFGFNFGGALFTDIGNIWNHFNNEDGNGAFKFKYLYRDLAMCVGTGLRVDVSYLVLRLDAAYKLKDPVRGGDGWIKDLEWKTPNRLGYTNRRNLGFQFGIGYPF
jgi:outer membrane protein insertion porin family